MFSKYHLLLIYLRNVRSIFTHENKYGNAPASKLFKLVEAALKDDLQPPRKFEDYEVIVDAQNIPSGVNLHRKCLMD